MLKILIADDHAIVREGLKQILAEYPDMEVAGEASTGRQVLEMVRKGEWDLVLLDITMPETNGLDTLKELKKEKPDLPVLMLSMHPEEQYAIRSPQGGGLRIPDQGERSERADQRHTESGTGREIYQRVFVRKTGRLSANRYRKTPPRNSFGPRISGRAHDRGRKNRVSNR